jgi:glycine/D-amino acid oxidase-like deaminating enzyme
MTQKDIIVIGGGIVGASIAWHLTRAGAKVRLIAGKRGGVATPTSFAWINASWGTPLAYFKLRTHSIRLWSSLAEAVPDLPLAKVGGLCWDLPEADLLAYEQEHAGWGYSVRSVTADEAAVIEPALKSPPALAAHVAEEGAAEPALTAEILINDAIAHGAELIEGVPVIALNHDGGRISGVVTDAGVLAADHVVVAAGIDTVRLAAAIGIDVPVDAPPGLIVHSRPVEKILSGLMMAPELHVRQTLAGRIIAGTDFAGTDPGEHPERAAAELFAKVQEFLIGGDGLGMEFYTVGYRPTPRDGFPILGAPDGVEGLTLAVTHSGVTLAPAIGALLTDEILAGAQSPLLAPYRLSRFS